MKVLYLCRRYYWDRKFSRGRFEYITALDRHCTLHCTGDGFPGYNSLESLNSHLDKLNFHPDAVIYYKAQDHIGAHEFDGQRVVIFNEANHEKTLEEIEAADATLIVFHHQNDMPRWRHLGIPMASLLHCSNPDIFCGDNRERPIDCLLSGTLSQETYPLRSRFQRLIHQGKIPGVIRPFPGYRLPNREASDAQFLDYANQLKQAKISLCCTSKFRYPLAKIVESMMAGCLVVSDMPDDREFQDRLGEFIIEVQPDDPDDVLCDVIHCLLAHPDELRDKAVAGQRYVMNHFTTDDYAKRLLGTIAGLTDETA